MNTGTVDSFAAARREIEEVSRLLIDPTPDVLENCRIRLSNAVAQMEVSRAGWRREIGQVPASAEVRLVRKALLHARRLLEKAARFHAGWYRMVASAASGEYRADGSVPELPCPRQVYVRG